MSTPSVPPRPIRNHHLEAMQRSGEMPEIPPRPMQFSDRSNSPLHDHYPRSPFNEPPNNMPPPPGSRNSGSLNAASRNGSAVNLNQLERPPSVVLPSIGQEGNEYENMEYQVASPTDAAEGEMSSSADVRNVAGDLPLHAPQPIVSEDAAKKRVSAVVHTVSGTTTPATLPKAGQYLPEKRLSDTESLREKASLNRLAQLSANMSADDRPGSSHPDDEHGIPEIGQRVPMYPDAGDVQAPSPSPFQQVFPAGVGFHNSGAKKGAKHHRRTPSGREVLPPDSYGMHGHGMTSTDHFERQWYAKHPDALEREEHGEYGPGIGGGRGEWALSSDDLNKLVRDSARKAKADGILPNNEQIGYQASDEYASRLQSPASATFKSREIAPPSTRQDLLSDKTNRSPSDPSNDPSAKTQLPSDPVNDKASRVTRSSESVHVPMSNERSDQSPGNIVPILASDEVSRIPGAEFMQPAVSPAHASSSNDLARALSMPMDKSEKGTSQEDTMNDDLVDDAEGYEPLFDDEDGQKRPVTASERLKKREQMKRFPSQDVWEDTPTSLQLQATVDTPEPEIGRSPPHPTPSAATTFETPAQEAARKGEATEDERAKLISREDRLRASTFKPHLREEMRRPDMRQRFPSRDIWEDSPDSAELTAIVGSNPSVEAPTSPDPAAEAGAIVNTLGRSKTDNGPSSPSQRATEADKSGTDPDPSAMPDHQRGAFVPEGQLRPREADSPSHSAVRAPEVPSRPVKQNHESIPLHGKTSLPPSGLSNVSSPVEPDAQSLRTEKVLPSHNDTPLDAPNRPSSDKGTSEASSELPGINPAASARDASGPSPAASNSVRSKPIIPARPTGSKIAALQAGFMADLDSRLKVGPPGPKPQPRNPAPEEEASPLLDARKGRAKGPVKRRPATGGATDDTISSSSVGVNWAFSTPTTIWQTDASGKIVLAESDHQTPRTSTQISEQQVTRSPALEEPPSRDLQDRSES